MTPPWVFAPPAQPVGRDADPVCDVVRQITMPGTPRCTASEGRNRKVLGGHPEDLDKSSGSGGILVGSAADGSDQARFADARSLGCGVTQAGGFEVRPSLLRA